MEYFQWVKKICSRASILFFTSMVPLFAEEATPIAYKIETFADRFQKQDCRGFADNVHGFFDLSFKNKYVTPRGLLVSDKDLTVQLFSGLIFDIYQNSSCAINQVSFVIGAWNDLSTQQENSSVGSWNELDWFAGFNFTLYDRWKFNAQYIEFLSPPGFFKAEQNVEFTLLYDDGGSWCWPIAFNPYAKLFYAISGDSTVIVGKRGGTYYGEFGLLPVLELTQYCPPLIITAPTWFSVGPAEFWNGGVFGLKDETSNLGLFSTGVRGDIPLNCISPSLGKWYFNLGMQYYYLINDNLLEAQLFQLGEELSEKRPRRNIAVAYCGISLYF